MEGVATYEVGKRYTGIEHNAPEVDSVGLIFEGVPIYKLWLTAPVDAEISLLKDTCTHIGLSSTRGSIGQMPVFVFGNADGTMRFRIQAPMCCSNLEIDRWGKGDSNLFIFVVIDRDTWIVRSITVLGVPKDMRRMLLEYWSTGKHINDIHPDHYEELRERIADESFRDSMSALWAYNRGTDSFDRIAAKPPKGWPPKKIDVVEIFEPKTIKFAQGEFIQFTRPFSKFNVAAYERGTITKLDKSGNLVVRLKNGNRYISFNIEDHPFLDYVYAINNTEARLKSTERLALDDGTPLEYRRQLVNVLLEEAGYVPIQRAVKIHVSGAGK